MSVEDVLSGWERLAQSATPEPWELRWFLGQQPTVICEGYGVIAEGREYPNGGADMAFVAASRAALPAAVAALRAALDLCLSIEADAREGQRYAGEVNNGALLMAESLRETTARQIRVAVTRAMEAAQ